MGGTISTVITILFMLVAVLMTFLILLQEGKGGGLAALGGTKAAGVEGVTNPIRRATAWLAAMFFVLAIVLGVLHRPEKKLFKGEDATATAEKTGDEIKKATGAPAEPILKVDAPKAIDVKPNVVKPDAVKPDAAKPDDKKTDEAKPVEPAKVEPPKADAPKADAPKADAPKADAPKVDEKKADAPAAPAPAPVEPKKEEAPAPAAK